MKKYLNLLVLMVFLISGLSAQEQKSKKEQRIEKKEAEYKQTLELIQSGHYKFEARKAIPIGGQQIDLTTNTNFLSVKSDSVEAYLPFFGRAYSATTYAGGGSGIQFNSQALNYTLEPNDKKQSIQINFNVKGVNDEFQCGLIVFGSGYATLSVTSRNRAFISYYGNVYQIEAIE